jgi:hypothetical protein
VRFWLGTHETSWLRKTTVPLFISHRRLAPRKTLPRAAGAWALDSGGFTELNKPPHRYVMTEDEYVEAVQRYQAEIGGLAWAAPMDWMCEPFVLEQTGLTVREHQQRTVENYLRLRDRGPFIPVLQGWELSDYLDCITIYEAHGVDLTAVPLVGVGSVCRRQNEDDIGRIFWEINRAGIRCHGFGVKKRGLALYGGLLASADSLAWSYNARKNPPLPGHTHKSCANCIDWALMWRDDVLANPIQMDLVAA